MIDSRTAAIYRISVSLEIGHKKSNVKSARVIAGKGLAGDAHSETIRPISLLPFESFAKVAHPDLCLKPGDFAENITTIGLDFSKVRVGARLLLGNEVEIEIVDIGKDCHNGCAIRDLVGDCIMPNEGVFAKAITGGILGEGDSIRILN